MKYYKFFRYNTAMKYSECFIKDNSIWKNENLYCNEIQEIHNENIEYVLSKNIAPVDFPNADAFLISKRFFDIINKLNKNFSSFKSLLFWKNEITDFDFYTIIFPKYKLLNLSKSDYETDHVYDTNEEFIWRINKIVLNKKQINILKDDNFFCLEEEPITLICTGIAKQAIEEAGLTGIAFVEVPVE